MISGVGDVFVMKMYFAHIGDYEMNNHVVEYEQDRRIGWEPEPGAASRRRPGSPEPARWGHRWSYQLTPDGPDATIVTEIYDCSRAPEEERAGMDNGNVWAEAMAETLERLTRCAPGKETSPVRRRLAGRGSRSWAEELLAVAAAGFRLIAGWFCSRVFGAVVASLRRSARTTRRKPQFSIFVASCALNSLGLLEFDAVFGEPGQQVMAPGADEAASGEPGVIGDLGDRRRRREE